MIAFFIVIVVAMFMLVAPVALEGVGEPVKEFDSIDESFDGTGIIDNLYTSVMVYTPAILLFGFGIVIPVAWYIRRQQTTGLR